MKRLLLACALATLVPAPAHAQQPTPRPEVTVVEIAGGIDGSYAAFLRGELRRAERVHDVAIVLRLSGSGSIEIDDSGLVAAVRESPVPVATWVGPRGTHADLTHAALWYAGDIRLRAEGTRVGPGFVGTVGEPGAPHVVPRPANATTANTIFEAVKALDGRSVNGTTLHVGDDTIIRFAKPGPVIAVRHALATNPTLVYLLLLCGVGAIVFEAFQPGFGPAGYAGALLVALAAYGLVALPTNPFGLAATLLGIALMAFDVRRNELSLPTYGGAVVLAAGSWWLVHSYGAALRPATWAIAVGVLGCLVFYGVVMTVVLRALRGQAGQIGPALIGRTGEVRSTLNPQGHVLVEGALWRARAVGWDGPVAAGTPVRVAAVDEQAFVIDVEPVEKE